jgi:hypothetical protein
MIFPMLQVLNSILTCKSLRFDELHHNEISILLFHSCNFFWLQHEQHEIAINFNPSLNVINQIIVNLETGKMCFYVLKI